MTIPHITALKLAKQWFGQHRLPERPEDVTSDQVIKAIEIALAEQSAEQYITAKKARKLVESGGQAEWRSHGMGVWLKCEIDDKWFDAFSDGRTCLYRAIKQAQPVSWNTKYLDSTPKLNVGSSAFEDWFQAQSFATHHGIKQMCRDSYAAGMGDPLVTYATTQALPEPADPHAALRAEYAKQVAEGTVGFYLWEYESKDDFTAPTHWVEERPEFLPAFQYRYTDISCMVSKDGEPAIRMLRTDAQELQRKMGDTVTWSHPDMDVYADESLAFNAKGTYTYSTRATVKQAQSESIDLELARAMCRSAGISLVSRDFIEQFADFVMDWRKGDFTLPKYAELDMQSCFNAWQAFDPDLAITHPAPFTPITADMVTDEMLYTADVPYQKAVYISKAQFAECVNAYMGAKK